MVKSYTCVGTTLTFTCNCLPPFPFWVTLEYVFTMMYDPSTNILFRVSQSDTPTYLNVVALGTPFFGRVVLIGNAEASRNVHFRMIDKHEVSYLFFEKF